jgi:hypothetical protein
MTKHHKQFEKWAMPLLKQMQQLPLLDHLQPLELEYNAKRPHASESQFTYPYQSITIRYSDDVLDDCKNKKYHLVLGFLLHEMFHPITDALYAKACNTWRTKEIKSRMSVKN